MTERLAYRVPEAAEALGVSAKTVWRLIEQGELQAVQSGRGKLVLIPRVAIDEFLRRGMDARRPAEDPLPAWLQPMVRGGRRRR